MEKEYGKLTEDKFKRLIRQLPEFRKDTKDVQEAFRSASKGKLCEVLGDGVCWATVYERSLARSPA